MVYALLSKAVKHVTQAVKKFLKMGDFNPVDGDYKYGCAFAFVDYPEFKTSTIQTIFTKYRQKHIYEGKDKSAVSGRHKGSLLLTIPVSLNATKHNYFDHSYHAGWFLLTKTITIDFLRYHFSKTFQESLRWFATACELETLKRLKELGITNETIRNMSDGFVGAKSTDSLLSLMNTAFRDYQITQDRYLFNACTVPLNQQSKLWIEYVIKPEYQHLADNPITGSLPHYKYVIISPTAYTFGHPVYGLQPTEEQHFFKYQNFKIYKVKDPDTLSGTEQFKKLKDGLMGIFEFLRFAENSLEFMFEENLDYGNSPIYLFSPTLYDNPVWVGSEQKDGVDLYKNDLINYLKKKKIKLHDVNLIGHELKTLPAVNSRKRQSVAAEDYPFIYFLTFDDINRNVYFIVYTNNISAE